MKDNFIHVCFILDESGSMGGSVNDVIGGFTKTLEDQKSIENGQCSVSLYKFNNTVHKIFVGKDISKVEPLKRGSIGSEWDRCVYNPGGCTAMYDGIGTAIKEIGEWLSEMPESERPSKNLIVIMTDGEENASSEYTAQKVKDMIKEQETKYSWTFVYMGTDITTTEGADALGLKYQVYSTRACHSGNFNIVSEVASQYRTHVDAVSAFANTLDRSIDAANRKYEAETGNKITKD